jgi:hypothetical protein
MMLKKIRSAFRLRKAIGNADAELAGVILPEVLPKVLTAAHPEIGTVNWAVQTTVLEKFESIESFKDFYAALSPEQQMGWSSLLKGRAAEHLIAHDEGGLVHDAWNVPGHDVITPEGDFIQVKTGTVEYIQSTLDDIDTEIVVHSGIEGEGLSGVVSHNWSDDDLEATLQNVDDFDLDSLEILNAGIVTGTVLSAASITSAIKAGEIQLNEAPRLFAYKSVEKGARFAAVGISLSSGSPILVTGATAYVIYRSRFLLQIAIQSGTRVVQIPRVKMMLKKTGQAAWWIASHPNTRKGGILAIKGAWRLGKGLLIATKKTWQLARR